MWQELILFDTSKPGSSPVAILSWTLFILVASQLIFIATAKLFGLNNMTSTLDNEKHADYARWVENNTNPWILLIGDLINSAVYAPVVEELIFRIVFMKFFLVKQLKCEENVANIIQAIVFGCMHLTNSAFSNQSINYTSLQSLSAGISGAVSGWVYLQSNSIFPSLIAHSLNNASASVSEFLGYLQYKKTLKVSEKK
jgi:membrane protease YdiL (CAAX protease family)